MHGSRERIGNAAMQYIGEPDLHGKRILLVDDIVTTGASMASAATLLRANGAKKIVGASFSIAYLDPYVPFEKRTF